MVLATLGGSLRRSSMTQGLLLFGALIALSAWSPFFVLILILGVAVLAGARENYGTLEACGIPVVKPTLFLGSEPNYHKTVLHLADIERCKELGGIWGVGRQPQVYIAGPELIRLVFVKDFVYFGDRQHYDFGTEVINEVLDFQAGEKWKTLRTCLSPLFTTAKLRQNVETLADCTAEFMEDLRAECGKTGGGRVKIDAKRRLTAWLIDVFARTTLGISLENAKNPDNKFAEAFREMMGENQDTNLLHSLSLSFPWLSRFAPTFNDAPAKLIESTFRQIMETRRRNGKDNAKDFLDVLCSLWDRVPSEEFRELGITETTIVAQAVNFFLGGYETSSTTLSHLLLHMAENPEVQRRMREGVKEALARKENGAIDHELTRDKEIPYILACLNESLRLAPPLYRPERICTKDWTHGEIKIKKGTVTMMASWPANRNPRIYPQPDEFKPERFLPENKATLEPYAFTSFGFGPRNCIGMRFAYENLKLFLCHLVLNFRVEKRPDTKVSYKPGSAILVGFKPLYLDLVDIKEKSF